MQNATNQYKLLKLLAISAVAAVMQSTTAFAAPVITIDTTNTVTFNDGTESLSLSISPGVGNNVDASVGCTLEICSVNLNPPSGYGSSGSTTSFPLNILDSGGSVISDILNLTRNAANGSYTVTFTSDGDPGGLGPYIPGVTQGDTLAETGDVQPGFILDWNLVADASHIYRDIIQFQSDVDSTTTTGVPEPISLTLFGAGLIGLGALRRRNKARA